MDARQDVHRLLSDGESLAWVEYDPVIPGVGVVVLVLIQIVDLRRVHVSGNSRFSGLRE